MEYSPGLRGVIAGETSISTVGEEGTSLRYRGYDATELTRNNTYEEVASLIINDSLDGDQFKLAFSKFYEDASHDDWLIKIINNLKEKGLHPMDVLRTIVSSSKELDSDTQIELAARISATVCFIIASYHDDETDEPVSYTHLTLPTKA